MRGIDVHGAGEHVVARREDRLRAVPVMGVEVEDGDAPESPLAKALRRDGRVVQVAGAAERGPRDVMARRPAAAIRSARTVDARGRPRSARRRRQRGRPPTFPLRRPSSCRSTTRRSWPRATQEPAARAPRGNREWGRGSRRRRAGPGPRDTRPPAQSRPGAPEELHEARVVDLEQRLVRMSRGEHDLRSRVLERHADRLGPLRRLVVRPGERRSSRRPPGRGGGASSDQTTGIESATRLAGEAVLGCDVRREERRGRAPGRREHAEDRQLAVGARVLDDVHLTRAQAKGRSRPELLLRPAVCRRPGPSGTHTISSYRW